MEDFTDYISYFARYKLSHLFANTSQIILIQTVSLFIFILHNLCGTSFSLSRALVLCEFFIEEQQM